MELSQAERNKLSSDQLVSLAQQGVRLSDHDKSRLSSSQLLAIHDSGQHLSEVSRAALSAGQLLVLAERGEVLAAAERRKLSGDQLLQLRSVGQTLTTEDRSRLSSSQLVGLRKMEQECPLSYRQNLLSQLDARSLANVVSSVRSSRGFHHWQCDAIAAHVGYLVDHFNGADLECVLEDVGKNPEEARPVIRRLLHGRVVKEKEVSGAGRVLYMDPADKEAYAVRFAGYLHGDASYVPEGKLCIGSVDTIESTRVFVVHGRNERARHAMFAFLRAIGLHPLEWNEIVQMTGKGSPYIGEVLEVGFSRAQAAVVLMTPDDEARLREQLRGPSEPLHERELAPQPRPNVLLEAGMALGLYQDRTVIVELGELRPISDILGRHVVRLDNSPERRQELATRLRAAGCNVRLDGVDWYQAGDFVAAIAGL